MFENVGLIIFDLKVEIVDVILKDIKKNLKNFEFKKVVFELMVKVYDNKEGDVVFINVNYVI